MSPDRLEALRRQRALVAQHLAWLDSEIAAAAPADSFVTNLVTNTPAPEPRPVASLASTASSSPPAPARTLSATPPSEPAPEALAVANARADEIIAQHAATDRFDPQSTKRGCILLASAVFLLGIAGAMFAYLLYYNE